MIKLYLQKKFGVNNTIGFFFFILYCIFHFWSGYFGKQKLRLVEEANEFIQEAQCKLSGRVLKN